MSVGLAVDGWRDSAIESLSISFLDGAGRETSSRSLTYTCMHTLPHNLSPTCAVPIPATR